MRHAHKEPTPISEILAANTFLKKLHENGEISVHEYIRRALVAAYSRQRDYLRHEQEIKDDPDYFSKKAADFDGLNGKSYKGHPIPSKEKVFLLEGGVLPPHDPIPI